MEATSNGARKGVGPASKKKCKLLFLILLHAFRDVLHSVLDSGGSVDPDKLEEWMRSNNVDPNDPANAELMERLANATSIHHAVATNSATDESPSASAQNPTLSVSGGHFRLDSHHDQLVFCAQSDIERNLRFRLLQLRREGQVPEFRSCRMVPPSEKEIPKGLFDNLGKK